MTKKEIEKFEEALVEQNAYRAFLTNFVNWYAHLYTLSEIYQKPKDVVLYSAFSWKKSPEGADFWFEVNEAIMQKLSKQQ